LSQLGRDHDIVSWHEFLVHGGKLDAEGIGIAGTRDDRRRPTVTLWSDFLGRLMLGAALSGSALADARPDAEASPQPGATAGEAAAESATVCPPTAEAAAASPAR
jgi:hypothetical protein